jgi:hypothetical protein
MKNFQVTSVSMFFFFLAENFSVGLIFRGKSIDKKINQEFIFADIKIYINLPISSTNRGAARSSSRVIS